MIIPKIRWPLLAIACLLSACDYSSKETPNSPLWGGFNDKTTYALVDDVYLLSVERNSKSHLALSPPGERKPTNRIYNAPRTLRLPQSVKEKDYVDGRYYNLQTVALGIVHKGTRLKVVEVRKERKFSWFFGEKTTTAVHAELVDGEYGGRVVDIRDISLEQAGIGEGIAPYKADPAFLHAVEEKK